MTGIEVQALALMLRLRDETATASGRLRAALDEKQRAIGFAVLSGRWSPEVFDLSRVEAAMGDRE
jgi:hypothetical protein